MSKMEGLKQKESLNEGELVQSLANGLIESIPEKGPLFEKGEKSENSTRAIAFGQFFNQLLTVSRSPGNLSRDQKEAIMKRIDTLKREAFFWTQQSGKKRNFEDEVEKMAQLIWRR